MPLEKKAGPTKFLLRLDQGLHRSLMDEARRLERSLNSEIVWRLRKSLEIETLTSNGRAA
jgi:hypothetical protein